MLEAKGLSSVLVFAAVLVAVFASMESGGYAAWFLLLTPLGWLAWPALAILYVLLARLALRPMQAATRETHLALAIAWGVGALAAAGALVLAARATWTVLVLLAGGVWLGVEAVQRFRAASAIREAPGLPQVAAVTLGVVVLTGAGLVRLADDPEASHVPWELIGIFAMLPLAWFLAWAATMDGPWPQRTAGGFALVLAAAGLTDAWLWFPAGLAALSALAAAGAWCWWPSRTETTP